jgi:hypothetical protein
MKYAVLGLIFLLSFATFAMIAFSTNSQSNLASGPFVYRSVGEQSARAPEKSGSVSDVDIINPVLGQYANYSHSYLLPNGTGWSGWWGMHYNEYVQPHIINTTQIIDRPELGNGTYWCTVDKRNRWIVNTDSAFWWNQSWYVPWIETNITIGSTINWFKDGGSVVGSKMLYVLGKYVDCWVVNSSQYELSYYDKGTGLMTMYQYSGPDQFTSDLVLNQTNILVGQKLSTMVYFNLNPNPAKTGDTLALRGILVDNIAQQVRNETLKIYARPLAGSWTYIASLKTNDYGIFVWQATIPSVPKNTYIFAIYYPGSQTHESSYNLAALVIQ